MGGLTTGAERYDQRHQSRYRHRTKAGEENYDAEVKLSIAPDIKLPKDSSATIASNGLMGNKFIKIEPGVSKELLHDGDEITNTKDFKTLEDLVGEVILW